MPAPTLGKADSFTAGHGQTAFREKFRTPTGNAGPGSGGGSTRPPSGAVYPRPTR